MRPVAATVAVLALLASHAGGVLAGAADVSKQEQAQWLRWLVPLPKQIRIEKKIELPASDVRVRLRKGAGDVEQTAAGELRGLLDLWVRLDLWLLVDLRRLRVPWSLLLCSMTFRYRLLLV